MPKKMIQPDRALLRRISQAFLDHGYAGLSMTAMAKACGFTQRALYYYFSNKEEALRASVKDRNAQLIEIAMEAGRVLRAEGGSALDIFACILDTRYGDTRRLLNLSPHTVEMNAEVFKRCRDLIIESAITFQQKLEDLILDLQRDGLLRLNGNFTATEISQALADGGRAVNQGLPPISTEDLSGRYRQMCAMVLYGCAFVPDKTTSRKKSK